MDEAVKALASRFDATQPMDKGFAEAVVEHLRLARDEGAQITANAFGEAEKLRESEPAAAPPRYDLIRDAVADISGQMTQAAILGSLVVHASDFAPRGAFFILKNDQFIGWRSFGEGAPDNESKLQALSFPVSQETVLSRAVTTLTTAESADGQAPDDKIFLEPLEYIRPDRMYAIPLVARGRGVAVLYADYGNNGIELNREALETLVRVAGLTVELRAAAQQAAAFAPEVASSTADQPAPVVAAVPVEEKVQQEYSHPAEAPAYTPPPTSEPTPAYVQEVTETAEVYAAPEVVAVEEPVVEYTIETAAETAPAFETNPAIETAASWQPSTEAPEIETFTPVESSFSYKEAEPTTSTDFEIERSVAETAYTPEEVVETPTEVSYEAYVEEVETVEPTSFETEAEIAYEEPVVEPEPVETAYVPAVTAEHSVVSNGHTAEAVVAPPVVQSTAPAGRSRFGDRSIDLPIEVPEEDRKTHNNARRFARLLVSEIKLYNEQKVIEGRETGDLYDRLREAIDRSREMYEKRVEPSVSSKFDYFHYEILNDLAAGDTSKLGANYPGAAV